MKIAFYNIYRILRSIIVTSIVTAVSLFVLLYLILSIPQVQTKIKSIGERELGKLLKTEVSIGRVSISPFNQVVLYDVDVLDQRHCEMLKVERLGAGVSLYNLAVKRRLVFTYAEIIGLNGWINRDTKNSPLNIQFVIDALSSKDKTKPPTAFDVSLYNVIVRKSKINYDVLSEPKIIDRFDKYHIGIVDLKADVSLPLLKNDEFGVKVNRLSFKEKKGFELKNLAVSASVKKTQLDVKNLRVELPNSLVTPDDFTIEYNDLKNLKNELDGTNLNVDIPNSYISLSDLAEFVPAFAKFNYPLRVTLAVRGTLKEMNIPVLSVTTDNQRVSIDANGTLYHLNDMKNFTVSIPHIELQAKADEIAKLTSNFAKLSANAAKIIGNCGNVKLDGSVNGVPKQFSFNGFVETMLGNLSINGHFDKNPATEVQGFSGVVSTPDFNIGTLLDKQDLLQKTAFNLKIVGSQSHKGLSGRLDGNINYVDLKGYRYNDIVANVDLQPSCYKGQVRIDDENIKLDVEGLALLAGRNSEFDVTIDAKDINLSNLNLNNKYPNHNLSFQVDALFNGNNIDNANGHLSLANLSFLNDNGEGVKLNNFEIDADNKSIPNQITLQSDIINGSVVGQYNFKSIAQTVNTILSKVFPSLLANNKGNINSGTVNDFVYNFKIDNNQTTDDLVTFFHLPVKPLYPITLSGCVSSSMNKLSLDVDAPYLQQKNKLIEETMFRVSMDAAGDSLALQASTVYPVKNGKMFLNIDGEGIHDRLDTHVAWTVDNKMAYRGAVDLSVGLNRLTADNSLNTEIRFKPTELVFNDTVWKILPSRIDINKKSVSVNNFKVACDEQFVMIDGRTSPSSEDLLIVDLKEINLNYIFDILSINNVAFGGKATGRFFASDLFTKQPKLSTPQLHVDGFAYNNALLGNADISSRWESDDEKIAINALIKQSNGYESRVDGGIFPTKDSLCLDFKAKKLNIAFMQPFMSGITSDIQGLASGYARLYGTFHLLNLLGDLYADDVRLKVDYTNVYYSVSDSIKIVPDLISFKNMKIHDPQGHTALMNGWVRHHYFHDASFDIALTDAKSLLCYDVTSKTSPNWYGTIYGNGSAFITGSPGVVNINVSMETAADSKFTFVLSNREAASEYNFITFKDRTKREVEDKDLEQSLRESILSQFNKKKDQEEKSSGTVVNINLQTEITPLTQMILVMDPVGGDKIKAVGNGNLRMAYNSADDAMTMYGKYTLHKGNYNFTLQDIIIKDFTINDGSSISFHGDPMDANIDIEAVYALNANLQDLDESFAADKEMNRTNVSVHALLKVSGDIKQPAIKFDLELPTLTSDAYRKVKSIISTDDMMNRQIIYLLALNRFYTPDYMGGTTKNNELASVASSTISSQLSSMLGQLSDNWSISPNFRSDKGDFSDVEVELALSSHLLNNRLLLNGNFGYRDNTLNVKNSNFVGDFDVEYLLIKNGGIRLKAYNHFNDQNYYVKNALTTQGVGVVFKYDFNRPLDFIHKIKKSQIDADRPKRLKFKKQAINRDSIK